MRSRDRVHVAALYDVDERKRHGAAGRYGVEAALKGDKLETKETQARGCKIRFARPKN